MLMLMMKKLVLQRLVFFFNISTGLMLRELFIIDWKEKMMAIITNPLQRMLHAHVEIKFHEKINEISK